MKTIAIAIAVTVTGALSGVACSKAPAASDPAPASGEAKKDDAKHYTLDVKAGECKATGDCSLAVRLVTAGDFHVNEEYPYKFVATPVPEVTYLGKQDANTFTRATGDFRSEGPTTATMTVRFRPAKAGDVQVKGSYKLSVCSKDACQIDTADVDTRVPVLPSS
jgi:hypothetical protein